MKSLSNLLKKGATITKTERVIDYNDLIKQKLETLMEQNEISRQEFEAGEDGFVSGLSVEMVEQIPGGEEQELSAQTAATIEPTVELVEKAEADAQEIRKHAQEEADILIQTAHTDAQLIRDTASQEGYEQGIKRAQEELENTKESLENELRQKREQLELEYEEKRNEIEPELVEVLTDIFRKVTLTVAEDNQEIILHLINTAMKDCESSNSFTIHTSKEDYPFLIQNQGRIYCAMHNEVSIDILEDMTLNKNECSIETDSGVFNCSLDVELKQLISDIKLLSCMD